MTRVSGEILEVFGALEPPRLHEVLLGHKVYSSQQLSPGDKMKAL